MKKIMIAAAAAAMVSGAFAVEYVYDYSASLKTTKVKTGSETTTYTVNLGMDASGKYWWDGTIGTYTDAKTAKAYVNKLDNDTKRQYAINSFGFDEDEYEAQIAAGVKAKNTAATDYPVAEAYDSKGNAKTWCFSFTYKVTETDCYRVAGSKKITDRIYVADDCCEAANWEFEDMCPIQYELFYRFGGITAAKATKVEVVGSWKRDDSYDKTTIGRDQESFAVAGQGTWSDKLARDTFGNYVAGVKSISGNIVGWIVNPGCKDCCNYPVDALCFECDGTPVEAENDADGYVYSDAKGTAAYGTWSIKFNKGLSDL